MGAESIEQAGDRNSLVVENLDLVGRVVTEVSARYPRHVDRSELWNAGALGLVEASRRYDPSVGIPFRRYAAIRIKGAVIDSTRTRDWASRSVRRNARAIDTAVEALADRGESVPDDAAIAGWLGISEAELESRRADLKRSSLLHLDAPTPDGGSLAEVVTESATDLLPDEWLEEREMRGMLKSAIGQLPSQQAETIRRSYLLGEPLHAIAVDMGLTEARLSQIRSEAVTALRAYFATQFEGLEPISSATPGGRSRAAYLERMAQERDLRDRLEAADR